MATSIHDILRELRSVAYDERDKGDRFERLMRSYLTTEPQYAQLYDEVWMWTDYPQRGTRRDTGIDLVARTRDTGEVTAIQCKFFDPSTTVTKPMLDSFLAASSKNLDGSPEFTARLVISTSDNWGSNAEDAVENQNPPVQRLRVQDLDESSIDWGQFSLATPGELTRKAAKELFPYQELAISKVVTGFETADRGKLIMSCGTGKTLTSLKLVEQVVPRGGTVLFLVPSISLLSQTLKEWTIESAVPLRSFAVCSDVSVGKRKSDEDIPVTDLAYPATTNTTKLVEKFAEIPDDFDGITVVFSTYQSIDVVAQAQGKGIPDFDLIVCDEAHRTTGVTLAGDEESAFVKVHNQNYIKGKKRLYMTATPRIYADASRSKAEEVGAVLTDMNNAEFYGEEFHRLRDLHYSSSNRSRTVSAVGLRVRIPAPALAKAKTCCLRYSERWFWLTTVIVKRPLKVLVCSSRPTDTHGTDRARTGSSSASTWKMLAGVTRSGNVTTPCAQLCSSNGRPELFFLGF